METTFGNDDSTLGPNHFKPKVDPWFAAQAILPPIYSFGKYGYTKAARSPGNEIQYYITSVNTIGNFLVVLIKVEQQQTTLLAKASGCKPTADHVR